MKVIDILNAKANGTLKDGFKFRYGNDDYKYKKEIDAIIDSYESDLGCEHIVEQILNDEVEVIEENEEIEELPNRLLTGKDWTPFIIEHHNKINELVRAVNKINKQLEEIETEDTDTVERELNKMFKEREEK